MIELSYYTAYLTRSLDELYMYLHATEKEMLKAAPLEASWFENEYNMIINSIKERLPTEDPHLVVECLLHRKKCLEELYNQLYKWRADFNTQQSLTSDPLKGFGISLSKEKVECWITQIEDKLAQTEKDLATFSELAEKAAFEEATRMPSNAPNNSVLTINQDEFTYEVQRYFAKKVMDACDKQENVYRSSQPPMHLHPFKVEQSTLLARIEHKLRDIRKAGEGTTCNISPAKMKSVFESLLEADPECFTKVCTDYGVSLNILQDNNISAKAEALVTRCQESPVLLYKLICYSYQENYQLEDFLASSRKS